MTAAAIIHQWFVEHSRTLCCAESLTAGHVQAALTAQSGASKFFRGGITAYDIAAKARLLGVDEAHARAVNAVSARVATEMAFGACRLFEAEFALATTGYAEPFKDESGSIIHPHAYYAVVRGGDSVPLVQARVDGVGLSRVAMQQHVTEAVLQALAAQLLLLS